MILDIPGNTFLITCINFLQYFSTPFFGHSPKMEEQHQQIFRRSAFFCQNEKNEVCSHNKLGKKLEEKEEETIQITDKAHQCWALDAVGLGSCWMSRGGRGTKSLHCCCCWKEAEEQTSVLFRLKSGCDFTIL